MLVESGEDFCGSCLFVFTKKNKGVDSQRNTIWWASSEHFYPLLLEPFISLSKYIIYFALVVYISWDAMCYNGQDTGLKFAF